MSKRSWAAKAADLERRFRDELARRRLDRTNPPIMRKGSGPSFPVTRTAGKQGAGRSPTPSAPTLSRPWATHYVAIGPTAERGSRSDGRKW
jgi:hypothetical protein